MMSRPFPLLMLTILVVFPPLFGPSAQAPDDDEGIPGLRIDPDLLPKEDEAPDEGMTFGEEDGRQAQLDRMRRVNLEILARYPGEAAVTLIEELVARGADSEEFLTECLNDPNVKVRMAGVHGLRELRSPDSFIALEAAAAERRNSSRLQVLADAMLTVDRDRGLGTVAGYLDARRSIVRRHARDALLTHLRADEAEDVLSRYLESTEPEARQFALQILVRLQPTETMPLCFAALRDDDPAVCYAAAVALADHADDGDIKQLVQLVNDFGVRRGPYAILALVMAEDRRGDRLFDEDNADAIISAFSSTDLLERGAAAIGMANLSAWREDSSFKQLLDRRLVPVLIDTVSSTTYYPDHQVLRDLVLRKLVTLTGKNLSFDWAAWREWWLGARQDFEAQRGLKSAATIDPGQATIRWLATGQRGDAVDVTISASLRQDEAERPRVRDPIRLSRTDMGALIDGMAYEGFFDLPETIGDEVNAIRRVTVVLSGGGRTKGVTMVGSPRATKAEVFTSVLGLLADIRQYNQWQRYHDSIGYPDRYDWWIANYKWWSSKPEPEAASRRLRSMIIASLDQLPDYQRRSAFRELAVVDQLTRDPITQEEAYFLVGPLGDGNLSREQARLACAMLARAAHREALGPAIASVVGVESYDSQSLAVLLFKGYGRQAVEAYISHPDQTVRAAAAEALGGIGPADARAFELLELRLDDRETVVQAAAAFGLGQLGSEQAIEMLTKRLPESERFVKKGILHALGKIGGPRAVEELVPYAMDRDRLVRQSALTALGASGDVNAIVTLMAALHSETSPIGRKIVSEALASFPGDAARKAVLDRLGQEKNPTARITLIETAAHMTPPADPEADETVATLRRLAREEQGEVREAVVLGLATLGDTTAVPALYGLLADGENPRAVAALRRLTYQELSATTAAATGELYREWWQNNREKSWKWWLIDALAQSGYSPIRLFEAISGGEDAMSAVPTLIDALTDDRRELRRGVAQLLTELTGQDFGDPSRATDDLSLAVLAAKWRAWYETTEKRR